MRKATHRLIGGVLQLLLIAQATALLHIAYRPAAWSSFFELSFTGRIWSLLAGMSLVALVTLYLVTAIQQRTSKADSLTFKQNGVSVSIRTKAAIDFISRIGDEFAAITILTPSIYPKRGGVAIDLIVQLKAGTQIPELCQLLEERVRESAEKNLGLSDIKQIRIEVKDLVGEPPPADDSQYPMEAQEI